MPACSLSSRYLPLFSVPLTRSGGNSESLPPVGRNDCAQRSAEPWTNVPTPSGTARGASDARGRRRGIATIARDDVSCPRTSRARARAALLALRSSGRRRARRPGLRQGRGRLRAGRRPPRPVRLHGGGAEGGRQRDPAGDQKRRAGAARGDGRRHRRARARRLQRRAKPEEGTTGGAAPADDDADHDAAGHDAVPSPTQTAPAAPAATTPTTPTTPTTDAGARADASPARRRHATSATARRS